ncbi:MAG: C39 family peptidase [Bacteroidota bacterium]
MKMLIFPFLLLLVVSGCSGRKGKLLDFPNLRQAHDYSCGPGAVQAVMAYYGDDFRESELIDLMKTSKDKGTYIKDIVKFLHYRGLSATIKHEMTTHELFSYIDENIPVIVLIQAWGNENDFKNRYKECWDDGHFVVVVGYSDKNILISDPAIYNTGYIPISEFIDRWHDFDEGDTKTYQLGIPVFGKKPKFNREELIRIE